MIILSIFSFISSKKICFLINPWKKKKPELNIFKEGYLYKLGSKIKNWKKRWFTIEEEKIDYFKKKTVKKKKKKFRKNLTILFLFFIWKSINVQGSISLEGVEIRDGFESCGNDLQKYIFSKQFTFTIWHPTKRIYVLAAESNEEKKKWMEILTSSIVKYKKIILFFFFVFFLNFF